MAEAFDPYLQWLGIRDTQRPPNHYRLLGVELFEADPEVLHNAVDRQMAHIRTFQSGKRSAESQRVLNELAAARVCLLNAEKKAAYDAKLKAELEAAGNAGASGAGGQGVVVSLWGPPVSVSPPPPPPPPPLPPLVAPPVVENIVSAAVAELSTAEPEIPGLPAETPSWTGTLKAAWSGGQGQASDAAAGSQPMTVHLRRLSMIAVIAAIVSVLLSALIILFNSPEEGSPPSKTKQGASPFDGGERDNTSREGRKPPPSVGKNTELPKTPDKNGKGKGNSASSSATATNGPDAHSAKPNDPKTPPGPLPPFRELRRNARMAMRVRDLERARQGLMLAKQAVGDNDDHRSIEHLSGLLEALENFWKAVAAGMADLKPGDSVRVSGQAFPVVECTTEQLVLQRGDAKFACTLRTMPCDLALVIARNKLSDQASSWYSAAVFLAMDAGGNRNLAQQLAQEAQKRGQQIEPLLMELHRRHLDGGQQGPEPLVASVPVRPPAPPEKPADPPSHPEPTPPPKTPPATSASRRLPVPEAAAVEKSRQEVRSALKDRYTTAKDTKDLEHKKALVGELHQQARAAQGNPAKKYALLCEARDVAISAGDGATVRRMVRETAQVFEIDYYDDLAHSLTEASKASHSSTVRKDLARASIELSEEAISQEKFEAAAQLAKAGQNLAIKARDATALARQGKRLGDEVSFFKDQAELSQRARERLATEPDNPKANLTQGKWLCLIRDQWPQGLPLLAKGDSGELKAAATAELAGATSSVPELVKRADLWYDAIDAVEEPFRRAVRHRALRWYEQADFLLPRARTKQRVQELRQALDLNPPKS